MIQGRKKRNSSKINLVISFVFHTVLILAVFFFAAREGMLGKKLKQITVTMVPKEKPPEPPKQKPPEPKIETPKVAEAPRPVLAPEPKVETAAAPPPVEAPPAAAPVAVDVPAFQFNDGAKEVQSVSDPSLIYKGLVEHALRSRWDRPEGLEDQNFVAEVEVSVDHSGQFNGYTWVKGSGNKLWDDSVKAALAKTTDVNRPPPKGFPDKFLVRFDVESLRTEDAIQVSQLSRP
jgi:outer membrane biosynthesis protein TonB